MTGVAPLRAAVVFRSHTGTTERLANEIAAHLVANGVDAVAMSVGACDTAALASFDLVFLGCWTNGWFVVRQHPDGPWVSFARDLPDLSRQAVVLFTTYTLATGSMFAAMRRELVRARPDICLELKSRSGRLSEADGAAIDRLLASRATPASAG